MTDRHLQKPYPLRMPDDMRAKLEELSAKDGRSLHAEILRRLEWALSLAGAPTKLEGPPAPQQPVAGALTFLLTSEINQLATSEGIAFDEMFAKIVLAGLHQSAPQVLYLPLLPGTSKDDLRAALQASEGILRPDAAVIFERLAQAPWAPEWMVQRLQEQSKTTQPVAEQPKRRINTRAAKERAKIEMPEPPALLRELPGSTKKKPE